MDASQFANPPDQIEARKREDKKIQKILKKKKQQKQKLQERVQLQQPPIIESIHMVNYINCKLRPKWHPLGQYEIDTKTAQITVTDQVSNQHIKIVQDELNKVVFLKHKVELPFSSIYEKEMIYFKKQKQLFYRISLDTDNTLRCFWDYEYFMEDHKRLNELIQSKSGGKGRGMITFWVYGTNGYDVQCFIDKLNEFKRFTITYDLTEDEMKHKLKVNWKEKKTVKHDIYFMYGKIVIEALSNDDLLEAINIVERERTEFKLANLHL